MQTEERTLRETLALKKDARPAQDRPLRSLVGLVLVWGALYLTFVAHEKSDSILRIAGGESVAAAALKPPVNAALDPIFKLMLPLELKQLHTSPRQMIRNIASLLGLRLDEASLGFVDDAPRDVDFKDAPAYQVLHELIDGGSGKYGLGVTGGQLGIFQQSVNASKESREKQWALEWEAELPLTTQPIAVIPSSASDLWFSVALTGPVEIDPSKWDRVRVEVWRGGETVNVSTATLDDRGRADVQQTSQGSQTFSIFFTVSPAAPDAARAGTSRMKLKYLEMKPKGA